MPKFTVTVSRTTMETAKIDVEADNEEEAGDEAQRMAKRNPGEYEWELDSTDHDVDYVTKDSTDDQQDQQDDDIPF